MARHLATDGKPPHPDVRVRLLAMDEPLVARLLDVAMTDAEPGEVMAPMPDEDGWTRRRQEAFLSYHRRCRPGPVLPPGDTTYGVVADGAVVGAARLAVQPSPHDLEVGLWLGRSSRGRGIGVSVLGVAAGLARRRGARQLVARTTADNPAAVRALTAQGFHLATDADGAVTGTLELGTGRWTPRVRGRIV